MSVTHEIVNEGLSLRSTYDCAWGTAVATVSWDTLEKAELNYAKAKTAFEDRLDELQQRMIDEAGTVSKSRLRRYGPLQIYTNQGPPTWWLPRLGFVKYGVKFGWLRLAVVASWEGKR